MSDAAPPATAPASAPATGHAASSASSDAALIGKFTAAHQAAVASELQGKHADAQKNPGRSQSAAAPASAAVPAPARAAGDDPGRQDPGAERDDAASGDAADAASDAAPPAEKAPDAALSESDAIALLRKSRDEGDTDGIDRALKALLPDSKGLSEFNVDGKRYAELRTVTRRTQKKLDARAAELQTEAENLKRGRAVLEQVVQRLTPLESLLQKAERGDEDAVDAVVEFVEKASKKKFNDIAKLHLDRKLGKQVDPEVAALKQELKAEKEARLAREKQEEEAREHQSRTQQIGRHLAFLNQTLAQHADPAVAALVSTKEGMRAIFEAQRDHYNPQTNTTLSAEQAAKFVLDQKRKELEPWQRVLGGGSRPAPALPAPAPAPTPRATPLRQSASASGPGGRALSDNELYEKYERIAKLAGG